MSEDPKLVLDTECEPGHVDVAVAPVDVDEQVQVAIRASFATGDRSEDSDAAHPEPLAELQNLLGAGGWINMTV